jgi:hypothetical protein
MSLVRGVGETCQTNQWRIAKCQGVETIVAAMRRNREHAMVQLSAVLCMIPLALENNMMQAHLTQLALQDVLLAVRNHPEEPDIQAKGLVVLGVLGQGDDVLHDAIREQQLECNTPALVAEALRLYGGENEEVLWAALFALAVLVREGTKPSAPAAMAVTKAGLLKLLEDALPAYKAVMEGRQEEPDEMIMTAGDYLIQTLADASQCMRQQEWMVYGAFAVAAVAVTAYAVNRYLRHR